jgi:hypothetical protein
VWIMWGGVDEWVYVKDLYVLGNLVVSILAREFLDLGTGNTSRCQDGEVVLGSGGNLGRTRFGSEIDRRLTNRLCTAIYAVRMKFCKTWKGAVEGTFRESVIFLNVE